MSKVNFNTEPVAISAAVRALLYVLLAFGTGITAEQIASIVVAVELTTALFVRSKVEPTK